MKKISNKLIEYKEKNKTYLILTAILILGLALRIYKLSAPSLWHDELMTFYRLQGTLTDTLNTLSISPFPPLYYLFMKGWTSLFGFSEFALRFPSVIFSTITIIYIFLLTKRLINEKTALIASFLLAIFPFAVNYAQEAKMYSMVWCFALASWYYFILFLEKPSIKNNLAYIITTLLLIYTLYLGFIFLIVQIIIFLLKKDKPIKDFIISLLLILIAYIPWLSTAINNIQNKSGIIWIFPTHNYTKVMQNIFEIIFGKSQGGISYLEISIYLASIIFLFFMIYKKEIRESRSKNYKSIFYYLLIPTIIFLLIDKYITPILVARYLGFVHISLIMFISHGLTSFSKRKNIFLIIILILLTSIIFIEHLNPYYEKQLKIDKEDWRGFFAEVCTKITNSTLVINAISSPEKILSYYGNCLPKIILPAFLISDMPSEKVTANYSYNTLLFLSRLAPQASFQLKQFKNTTKEDYYINTTIHKGGLNAYIFKRKIRVI